jgi:RNA polymerase sigma-70 factor (ECF subfamily)
MTARPDFAEFYAATFGRLTVQIHAFVGDHAEAQDLVQEAYCRAFARWSTVSGYDDPQAWVRRVAWNLAISRWRRVKRLRAHAPDLVAADVAGPDASTVDLARALKQLPPNQRQAVVLHYLADMSVADIAAFTGAAEGSVKAWLHRGRAALNTILSSGVEVSDV